jgi:steroid delta-isomerase-like uncharacterized protein
MATNAIKIMKDMMAALNSKDYEKTASFFTDDCVYEDIPSGKVFHSAKDFIDFAKIVRKNFPDRKWELVSAFSDGHSIATESVWSGTFTHSDEPKMPATGKHVSIRCVSITETRNGKISRNRDYYDGLSFMQQLGVMPAPPST